MSTIPEESNVSAAQSAQVAHPDVHLSGLPGKVLTEALDEPDLTTKEAKRRFRHPLYLDALMAIGLLVAMAGFTIGLVKIYITHTAKQYVNQRHYAEAITLLAGAPMPGWFMVSGENPEELLNEARYLDAMEKLDLDSDDQSAIKELERIKPGSKFYTMSNDILNDHAKPSNTTLQGSAEHEATPAEARSRENQPLTPPDDSDNK